VTVPANSSRLESYAKAEGFEVASGIGNTFESPCFRYPLIHVKGATASHSAGTIHGRSSLNGSSHPSIPLEGVWRLKGQRTFMQTNECQIKTMERSDFRPWTLDIPCWILDIQSFQTSSRLNFVASFVANLHRNDDKGACICGLQLPVDKARNKENG